MNTETVEVPRSGVPGWWPLPAFAVLGAILLRPYMAVATCAYLCLIGGVIQRRNRAKHRFWMSVGMTLDLGVVLLLEVNRHAVQTALGPELSAPQTVHVVASLLAVGLYFPIIALGLLEYSNPGRTWRRETHRRLGIAAFLCRTVGFLFMFSHLGHHR